MDIVVVVVFASVAAAIAFATVQPDTFQIPYCSSALQWVCGFVADCKLESTLYSNVIFSIENQSGREQLDCDLKSHK